MKKINLNLLYFLEFKCDYQLLDEICHLVRNVSYYANAQNQASKDKSLYHDGMIKWFNNCLQEVSKEIYNSTQLLVTQCWATKSTRLEFQHLHSHPNSIVSGILYLGENYKGGETRFCVDNPYYKLQNSGLFIIDSYNPRYEYIDITPEYGKLIIFPSTVLHQTKPIRETKDRYTIAFNSFFNGKLGSEETSTYLKLNTNILS